MGVSVEPNMRAIGPGFGKQGPQVKAAIEALDGAAAAALKTELASKGSAVLGGFTITSEHVKFSETMPENIFPAEMTDATVCVDVTLTEDLEAEGYAREVIRRLQEMRKQAGLNVEDTVKVAMSVADARVSKLIESWKDS